MKITSNKLLKIINSKLLSISLFLFCLIIIALAYIIKYPFFYDIRSNITTHSCSFIVGKESMIIDLGHVRIQNISTNNVSIDFTDPELRATFDSLMQNESLYYINETRTFDFILQSLTLNSNTALTIHVNPNELEINIDDGSIFFEGKYQNHFFKMFSKSKKNHPHYLKIVTSDTIGFNEFTCNSIGFKNYSKGKDEVNNKPYIISGNIENLNTKENFELIKGDNLIIESPDSIDNINLIYKNNLLYLFLETKVSKLELKRKGRNIDLDPSIIVYIYNSEPVKLIYAAVIFLLSIIWYIKNKFFPNAKD